MARRHGGSLSSSVLSIMMLWLLLLSFPVPALSILPASLQYAFTEIFNFVRIRTIGPACKTMPSIPDFDFNRYVAKSWYTQKHQVTEYYDYSERYCMVETYHTEDQTIVGKAQMVKYHTGQGGGGVNVNPYSYDSFCMSEYGDLGGQFMVAPCFVPSFLLFLGWPMYVVATDYDTYSIVTAGPLTIRGECDDRSGLCTVPNRGEIMDPGSWFGQRQGIFFYTREKIASPTVLAMMEAKAIELGICTATILPVTQEGCNYEGARTK